VKVPAHPRRARHRPRIPLNTLLKIRILDFPSALAAKPNAKNMIFSTKKIAAAFTEKARKNFLENHSKAQGGRRSKNTRGKRKIFSDPTVQWAH